jgi:hypothetical protein
VDDPDAASDGMVGDDAAMTAPPDRLGAHHGARRPGRPRQERLERLGERMSTTVSTCHARSASMSSARLRVDWPIV